MSQAQFQVQVPIAGMPINLVCLSNETLAFIRVTDFKALFDMAPSSEGVDAAFYEDLFVIDEVEYNYNHCYSYKEIPSMKAWIIQQKLQ